MTVSFAIMTQLNKVATYWNLHKIRPSHNIESPSGRRNVLHDVPAWTNATDYLTEVDLDDTDMINGIFLEVNSLTLFVGLVDSSLISFLLKLLQRGLTPIIQGKLVRVSAYKGDTADDISKPSIFLCRHRTILTIESRSTTHYSSHILSMRIRVVYTVTRSISTLIFIPLRLRSARTETRSII